MVLHFVIKVAHSGYFAMSSLRASEGLAPESLYYPRVFVWLPYLLDKRKLTCQNATCHYYKDKDHPLTIKGWNSDPVARRVVDLKDSYYIITQRFRCTSCPTGCGRTVNLYDPDILEQIDPSLVDEFPAFLTHRSGIDKTLMTLICAGSAHRVSSNAWSKILQELHVREHDLRELKYLHTVTTHINDMERIGSAVKTYTPFSGFHDQSGYSGFSPSRWYIFFFFFFNPRLYPFRPVAYGRV